MVAADDGVMPQTREHLRIIELLGIPAGLVALTKVDMVDRDLAELARADVEEFLASTRYADAPIVMVSGVTGEGLPELLAELDRLGSQVPPRLSYPATRMPVDRVFSLRGIGTVVTGTLWSGTLTRRGHRRDHCRRARGRGSSDLREVRVRSVQVHDREVDAATGGQRVALNLTGVARQEVDRGQWVVKDPAIEPTYLADARLTLLHDAPGPVPRVFRARVDHGTAEVLVKVVLADRETLAPGRGLLRPVPVRGAGAGLSWRPVHRPLGDPRDHHRRGTGHRPGGPQARHRRRSGASAWPSWSRERRTRSRLSCWKNRSRLTWSAGDSKPVRTCGGLLPQRSARPSPACWPTAARSWPAPAAAAPGGPRSEASAAGAAAEPACASAPAAPPRRAGSSTVPRSGLSSRRRLPP